MQDGFGGVRGLGDGYEVMVESKGLSAAGCRVGDSGMGWSWARAREHQGIMGLGETN